MFQMVYLCIVTGRIFFLPVSTNIKLEQYYFNIILFSLFETQLGLSIVNNKLIESNDILLSTDCLSLLS